MYPARSSVHFCDNEHGAYPREINDSASFSEIAMEGGHRDAQVGKSRVRPPCLPCRLV